MSTDCNKLSLRELELPYELNMADNSDMFRMESVYKTISPGFTTPLMRCAGGQCLAVSNKFLKSYNKSEIQKEFLFLKLILHCKTHRMVKGLYNIPPFYITVHSPPVNPFLSLVCAPR